MRNGDGTKLAFFAGLRQFTETGFSTNQGFP
jgi:hypothetical protein